MTLSPQQAALLLDVVRDAPAPVPAVALRIAAGEPMPDEDVDAVVAVLSDAMVTDYSNDEGLSERGLVIDDIIGIVQQMAQGFSR